MNIVNFIRFLINYHILRFNKLLQIQQRIIEINLIINYVIYFVIYGQEKIYIYIVVVARKRGAACQIQI